MGSIIGRIVQADAIVSSDERNLTTDPAGTPTSGTGAARRSGVGAARHRALDKTSALTLHATVDRASRTLTTKRICRTVPVHDVPFPAGPPLYGVGKGDAHGRGSSRK